MSTCRPTVADPPAGIRAAQSAPSHRMTPASSVQAIPHAPETPVACGSGQLTDQPSAGSPGALTTNWATYPFDQDDCNRHETVTPDPPAFGDGVVDGSALDAAAEGVAVEGVAVEGVAVPDGG